MNRRQFLALTGGIGTAGVLGGGLLAYLFAERPTVNFLFQNSTKTRKTIELSMQAAEGEPVLNTAYAVRSNGEARERATFDEAGPYQLQVTHPSGTVTHAEVYPEETHGAVFLWIREERVEIVQQADDE